MFKLFSLPTLLLASLAIGVVVSTPLVARDDGEIESCIIIPHTCFECAHAVCLPPRKSTTSDGDATSSE
ncbi:hypothetical protein C8J57DRAFT_1519104 [Mycena rebaudengoi]|nr:hypothetical protein C8J57DRAFT_1519104 [Mycena rebaudengoi]